jgi:hypothetical protein
LQVLGTPEREEFNRNLMMERDVVGTMKVHKVGFVTTTDADGDDDSNEVTLSVTNPDAPIQEYLEKVLEDEGVQRGLRKKSKKSVRARFYLAGSVVDEKAGNPLFRDTAIKHIDGWSGTFAACGKGTVNIVVTVPGERQGDLAKAAIAKKLKALLKEDMERSKEAAAVAREAGGVTGRPGPRTHVPFSMDVSPTPQTGASPGTGAFNFGSMGRGISLTPSEASACADPRKALTPASYHFSPPCGEWSRAQEFPAKQ